MSGKDGARHFAKPYIDPDIVFKILSDNDLILCNMGPYENVSRQNAPHPKGILHCSRLLMDLLSASETAEVHQSSLKKGLQQFLVQTPDAQTSKYSGEVWINLRTERLTVLLYHVRKLAQGTNLHQAAIKLTKVEYKQLQEILNVVKLREEVAQKEPHHKAIADIAETPRSLNKGDSDASELSMDPSGFPCMFASPSSSSKPFKKAETSEPLEKGETSPEKRRILSQKNYEKRRSFSQKAFGKRHSFRREKKK